MHCTPLGFKEHELVCQAWPTRENFRNSLKPLLVTNQLLPAVGQTNQGFRQLPPRQSNGKPVSVSQGFLSTLAARPRRLYGACFLCNAVIRAPEAHRNVEPISCMGICDRSTTWHCFDRLSCRHLVHPSLLGHGRLRHLWHECGHIWRQRVCRASAGRRTAFKILAVQKRLKVLE